MYSIEHHYSPHDARWSFPRLLFRWELNLITLDTMWNEPVGSHPMAGRCVIWYGKFNSLTRSTLLSTVIVYNTRQIEELKTTRKSCVSQKDVS